MKKNIFIIILSFLSVIFLSISLIFGYQKIKYGNYKDREELLTETIWQLQKEGYSKKDIYNIKTQYSYFKGGELPYEVDVTFKKDKSKYYSYYWKDINKKEIIQDGSGYNN